MIRAVEHLAVHHSGHAFTRRPWATRTVLASADAMLAGNDLRIFAASGG